MFTVLRTGRAGLPLQAGIPQGGDIEIESGVHADSTMDGDLLTNYAWVTPGIATSFVSKVQHTCAYPPKSPLLQRHGDSKLIPLNRTASSILPNCS
jgi:hypothetical protein